jgi:hypothetical protein
MMRLQSYLLLFLGLSAAGSAFSQSPTPGSSPASISPDKQWQYVRGDKAELIKTATNEAAVEFSCNGSESSVLVWAPDSMRFAISCPGGKGSSTSVYQLRNGKWEAGEEELGNGDAIMDRAGHVIEAQAKKTGMPKKTFLHMNRWTVEPEKWTDSSTLVVYAAMWEVAHRRDGSFADASYATDLLLTLKFDDSGAWKIIKTHAMSEKEVKRRESSAR